VVELTEGQRALFRGRNWGVVATLRADGSAQASTVWVDWDGHYVVFNTTHDSAKARNLARDPRVTVTVMDQEDPQRGWASVSGRAELSEEGAVDQLNRLSGKYVGLDPYPWLEPGERRVSVRVVPERVSGSGLGG